VGLLLLATVLILRTPKGTVVVEIDEPNAVVSVDDGKLTFTTTEAKQPLELRLSKGEHTVTVTREGSKPYTRRLLVKKGQTETIRIDLATASIQEPGGGSSAPSTLAAASSAGPPASAADKGPKPAPPLAVAPFDAAGAKQHQRAWADYLGVPVEMTNSIGIKFMLIPPGEFDMGSTQKEIDRLRQEGTDGPNDTFGPFLAAEVPRHRVRITRPFYLGTYEVTQGQYQRVTGTNPSHFSAGGKGQDKVVGKDTSSHPVETVSWDDAQQFCGKLSAVPGEKAASRVYRLPTEAEWEFTCRAGTTTRYHFGDDVAKLADFAWSGGGPNGVSSPVGLKSPNPWGLYDMHGNVWEWCADWYLMEDYYATSPADDPSGPASGKARIVRGGSWYNIPGNLRSSVRRPIPPDMRQFRVGLRVACRITNSPAGGAAL
jgi:formylglycine-generating enzyme required for sulfatase activity